MVARGQEGSTEKGPHCAEKCARFLLAYQIQPETQGQLIQTPSSNTTLWNWSESKKSRDVLREKNSEEAQLYQEQPPCLNSNPNRDTSGLNTLNYQCGTNHSMLVVQDDVHRYRSCIIKRHPF